MRFRKATKKDISQLFEIIKINSPKYPKKIALQELNEMFSKCLLRPTYIIAEDKNKIFGFGGYIPSWRDNLVYDMFWMNVHPEFQNKGIGTKLIRERIKRIKRIQKLKVKMILISTRIPIFYKKFGFTKVTSKYDGDYILMSLNLE